MARPATFLSGGAAPAPGQAETGAVAAAVAPLPTGWKDAKAPDGRTYYFHTETKETTWTRPAAALAAPAAADPPLPAGWKQAKAADGRTYYYYLPEASARSGFASSPNSHPHPDPNPNPNPSPNPTPTPTPSPTFQATVEQPGLPDASGKGSGKASGEPDESCGSGEALSSPLVASILICVRLPLRYPGTG